jgi:hypothetical protein
LTAVALSGALLGGATPASAAPVSPSAEPPATVMAPPGYRYLTWYWNETNCENNGARLQVRGVIRNYFCEQSPYLTYYLWVKY